MDNIHPLVLVLLGVTGGSFGGFTFGGSQLATEVRELRVEVRELGVLFVKVDDQHRRLTDVEQRLRELELRSAAGPKKE